ncbi:MAG: peptidylprolyl isomerase [Nitrospirae bacterium]|nr:peptidylprolyl isomerase [Nitrospirota bacterium]
MASTIFFVISLMCWPHPLWAQEFFDRIAAIVNDEVITLSELQAEVRDELIRLKARYRGKELDRRVTQKKYTVLNDLIEKKLLAQEARTRGIGMSDEEMDEAEERIAGGALSPDITLPESREEMRKELTLQKLMTFQVRQHVMVTPDDIRRHYEQFEGQFMESPEYHIRQILLLMDPEPDIIQTKQRAQDLYTELQEGEDFSEYAERYSDGPESVRGGDLGFIAKHELLTPIGQALDTMEVGEMSPPIQTSLGFHIIILDETQVAKAQSFDEVKDRIRNELFQKKLIQAQQKWLGDLKRRAYIEVKL